MWLFFFPKTTTKGGLFKIGDGDKTLNDLLNEPTSKIVGLGLPMRKTLKNPKSTKLPIRKPSFEMKHIPSSFSKVNFS
jgi:hypothetical protein